MTHHDPQQLYRIIIDGNEYNTSDPTLTPGQIKAMAGLSPTRLVYQITEHGQEHQVQEGSTVNLNGPSIETFITRDPGDLHDRQHYRLQVDSDVYEAVTPQVTGLDIKTIAGLPTSSPLYQIQQGGLHPVGNQDTIDLTGAGIERFTIHPPVTPEVEVTAVYTSNAKNHKFTVSLNTLLEQVVQKGYEVLGETRRPDDRLYTGKKERTDLQPYLQETMAQLQTRGLVLGEGKHLMFRLDIDAREGGA